METKAFKISDYWIWAIDYETALKHYELIMLAKRVATPNESLYL